MHWFRKAAEQGDNMAADQLAKLQAEIDQGTG
jgi:TPR repeat protein